MAYTHENQHKNNSLINNNKKTVKVELIESGRRLLNEECLHGCQIQRRNRQMNLRAIHF